MKAWQSKCCDVVSIVFADTRGQATAATVRSARSVGYNVSFADCRTTRAPELDGEAAFWPGKPRPINPSFIVEAAVARGPTETAVRS